MNEITYKGWTIALAPYQATGSHVFYEHEEDTMQFASCLEDAMDQIDDLASCHVEGCTVANKNKHGVKV